MLNQAAVDALRSATYVENYLDCVENLPDDVQRYISRLHELDISYRNYLKDVEIYRGVLEKEDMEYPVQRKIFYKLEQVLISLQEVGDEKVEIGQLIIDLIDNKYRSLDQDLRNLDLQKEEEATESSGGGGGISVGGGSNSTKETRATSTAAAAAATAAAAADSTTPTSTNGPTSERAKRARRGRAEEAGAGLVALGSHPHHHHVEPEPPPATNRGSGGKRHSSGGGGGGNSSVGGGSGQGGGKKKKRKSRASTSTVRDDSPPLPTEDILNPVGADIDEPTYCLCDQISYGEMILCDNDLCPIEWFHFVCVSLTTKPKGKWFCPKCRGDRPNVMKPKSQFLKELERYNKEKEEKS